MDGQKNKTIKNHTRNINNRTNEFWSLKKIMILGMIMAFLKIIEDILNKKN